MRFLTLGSFLLLTSCASTNPTSVGGQIVDTIGSTWKLRRSSSNPKYKDEAALVQITDPVGAASSRTVEAALDAMLWSGVRAELGAAFDYVEQTETGKEVDTIAAKLFGSYYFGDVSKQEPIHYFVLDAGFKDEREGDGEGVTASLLYTLQYLDWNLWWTSIGPDPDAPDGTPRWKVHPFFRLEPELKLAFERADDAGGSGSSGDLLRGSASLGIALFPARETDPRNKTDAGKVRLDVLGTYWNDIDQGGAFATTDDDHSLFRAGAQLELDEEGDALLRFEYVNGENPETGLARQEYVQIALGLKLGA